MFAAGGGRVLKPPPPFSRRPDSGPFLGAAVCFLECQSSPAMFGPCWGHVWTILGPFWHHVWAILGPCLGHVGPFWDHVWAMLGPCLDHFARACLRRPSVKATSPLSASPPSSRVFSRVPVFPSRPLRGPLPSHGDRQQDRDCRVASVLRGVFATFAKGSRDSRQA